MISANGFYTINEDGEVLSFVDLVGLSTDTKPTNCANGSKFLEMDTKKNYRFDEANETWREV